MTRIAATGFVLLPALAFAAASQANDAHDNETKIANTAPLANYRLFVDEPVASWRDANDKVGRIGGWKTYARENMPSDAAPAGQAAAPTPPSVETNK